MRKLAPLGLLLGSLLLACSGSAGDAVDGAGSAATETASSGITTGNWGGALKLVVTAGKVSGSYFSQVGDPAHGGATCSFSVAGSVTKVNGVDHAKFVASDGSDATVGELVATTENGKPALSIRTARLLNACDRSAIELAEPNGFVVGGSTRLPADVAGYRTASSEKAFFYDTAGGAPRSAHVVQGDAVTILGKDVGGFVKARFEGTTVSTGFLKTSDLSTTDGPAVPAVGKFEMPKNDYLASSFEVTKASASSITFNLSAVRQTGGFNNGDIEDATATIANDVATWTGDGCTISFLFTDGGKRASLDQEGACGDFGANVFVGGNYVAK